MRTCQALVKLAEQHTKDGGCEWLHSCWATQTTGVPYVSSPMKNWTLIVTMCAFVSSRHSQPKTERKRSTRSVFLLLLHVFGIKAIILAAFS